MFLGVLRFVFRYKEIDIMVNKLSKVIVDWENCREMGIVVGLGLVERGCWDLIFWDGLVFLRRYFNIRMDMRLKEGGKGSGYS